MKITGKNLDRNAFRTYIAGKHNTAIRAGRTNYGGSP